MLNKVTVADILGYLAANSYDTHLGWLDRAAQSAGDPPAPGFVAMLEKELADARAQLPRDNMVRLYRGLKTTMRDDLPNIHWTDSREHAQEHGEHLYTALVPANEIDWLATIVRRITWPREKEISVRADYTPRATIVEGSNMRRLINIMEGVRGGTFEVYHGTAASFPGFVDQHLGSAHGRAPINMKGFNFTDNPECAATFGPNVLKCRVVIERPKVIDAKGQNYSDFKHRINTVLDTLSRPAQRDKYDGVIITRYADAGIHGDEYIESTHYIPFTSAQINITGKLTEGAKRFSFINELGDVKP